MNASLRLNLAVLPSVLLVGLALTLGHEPLNAQDTAETLIATDTKLTSASQEESSQITVSPSSDAPITKGPQLDVTLNRGFECRRDPNLPVTEADSFGCNFTDTTASFSYNDTKANDGFSVVSKLEVIRATSGALSLDHQMRGFSPGMNAEAMVTNLGIYGSFFDERLEIEGKGSWSRSWDVPLAPAPLTPYRFNEKSGAATELRVKALLIDNPELKWTFESKFSKLNEDYQFYRAPIRNRLFALQGDTRSLSSTLDIKDWQFKASSFSSRSSYLASDTNRISARYSGITLKAAKRVSETDLRGLRYAAPSRSTKTQLSIDLDMYTLLPLVAVEDKGWKSLVPKMITLESEQTEINRIGSEALETISRSSIGGLAYWSTPLGDTLANLKFENQRGINQGFSVTSGSDLFVLLNHSFPLGDWSIDLDYFTSRSGLSNSNSNSEDTVLDSYGISARYGREGNPKVEMRLGRDNLDFLAGEGGIHLRDRSLRAEVEVDWSPWLKRKLGRDDMRLTTQFRWDFDNSSYEFAILDDIFDSDFTRSQARGLLLNFSMTLP